MTAIWVRNDDRSYTSAAYPGYSIHPRSGKFRIHKNGSPLIHIRLNNLTSCKLTVEVLAGGDHLRQQVEANPLPTSAPEPVTVPQPTEAELVAEEAELAAGWEELPTEQTIHKVEREHVEYSRKKTDGDVAVLEPVKKPTKSKKKASPEAQDTTTPSTQNRPEPQPTSAAGKPTRKGKGKKKAAPEATEEPTPSPEPQNTSVPATQNAEPALQWEAKGKGKNTSQTATGPSGAVYRVSWNYKTSTHRAVCKVNDKLAAEADGFHSQAEAMVWCQSIEAARPQPANPLPAPAPVLTTTEPEPEPEPTPEEAPSVQNRPEAPQQYALRLRSWENLKPMFQAGVASGSCPVDVPIEVHPGNVVDWLERLLDSYEERGLWATNSVLKAWGRWLQMDGFAKQTGGRLTEGEYDVITRVVRECVRSREEPVEWTDEYRERQFLNGEINARGEPTGVKKTEAGEKPGKKEKKTTKTKTITVEVPGKGKDKTAVKTEVAVEVTESGGGAKRQTALGLPATAIIRWLAFSGWAKTEITSALDQLGIQVKPATLQAQYYSGKKGDDGSHGKIPVLDANQQRTLKALRK